MIIRAHPVAVEVIAYSAEGMVHWTKVKSQRHEGSGLLTFAFRLLPLRGLRNGSSVLLFAAPINLKFSKDYRTESDQAGCRTEGRSERDVVDESFVAFKSIRQS